MRRSLAIASLCALAVSGLVAGIAVTGLSANPGDDPPNQGDPDKVFTVASGYQCDGTVVAGPKVEGPGLGRTITVTATSPIVQVTIKSGAKAALVSATWATDYESGTITISQDVSNYVVWTCAGGATTTGTTETTSTTGTTPTTTQTTPTTTETTSPTATTPATTETEPLVPLQPPATPEETEKTATAKPTPRPERSAAATETTGAGGVAGAQAPAPSPTPVLAHTP